MRVDSGIASREGSKHALWKKNHYHHQWLSGGPPRLPWAKTVLGHEYGWRCPERNRRGRTFLLRFVQDKVLRSVLLRKTRADLRALETLHQMPEYGMCR